MKTLILTLLLFSVQVRAGEYDEILAQDYRASRVIAGEREVASYAERSARVGIFLQAYIRNAGGDPALATCSAYSSYSCDGALCTPHSTPTIPLQTAGAHGYNVQSCDFSIGNRACKYGRAQCHLVSDQKERARCSEARMVIACVDRSTREQTTEYISSLGSGPRLRKPGLTRPASR